MTAYDPLTAGVGIYIPDDRHVARARWWLAAHPRTRDRAAIAAGVRREVRGLRPADVHVLMDYVLDGLGDWADPATWPTTWPEAWGTGEAHAPVQPPPPREAPPLPPAELVRAVAAAGPAHAPAVPRRRAPPRTPRPSRARTGERALPGAAEAVPEPIAGVPRWEGHPVRASRIPRHLCPDVLRPIAAGARWLLWRCAQPPVSGQPVTMERVMQEAGVTRKGVQEWLAALRGAGLMLTAHDAPGRAVRTRDLRPWASLRGPRPVDYSRLLTDAGRAVVAQLPAVVEVVTGRARADDADMGVLAVLLRRERQASAVGLPVPGMRTSQLRQMVDDAPRACARLEASGAITADWEARGRRIRLAAEVARAWGVSC